jgi:hypothetical protein
LDKLIKSWEASASAFLVGKTVASVRYLTSDEMDNLGWYQRSLVIFFSDGSHIFSSQDDEGNNAGALFTSDDDLSVIPTI